MVVVVVVVVGGQTIIYFSLSQNTVTCYKNITRGSALSQFKMCLCGDIRSEVSSC